MTVHPETPTVSHSLPVPTPRPVPPRRPSLSPGLAPPPRMVSRVLLPLLLGLGVAVPAAAQSQDPAPPGVLGLNEISITATRNPVAAFEYPGMVSVVGREQILERQASTPDDILKFVPNVTFTGGPRRTGEVPSIRGFSGADTVILLDGARQNFGSGHNGRFFVDPSLLRQVEVVRGPASSLYGSGGTGGVIEFRTVEARDYLRPGETFGGTLTGGVQSANHERSGTATVYGRPADGIDLVASATRRTSGSIQLGDGTKLDNSDDDILAGLAKGSVEFGDYHRLTGTFITFNNNAEEPSNGQGLGSNDIVDKRIRSNTVQAAYNYADPGNPLLDLDLIAYYSGARVDETRLDNLGAGPMGEELRRDLSTIGTRLDNRSAFALADDLSVTFTYGGEAYRDRQEGRSGTGARNGVPDATSSFYGGFAQGEFVLERPAGLLPGELRLVPGLRYDSYRSSSDLAADNADSQVSPRLAASYLPNDNVLVFGSFGDAFRAPTFNELYLTGVHFQIPIGRGIVNRFVPNPDLRPQTTRTLELGAGLSFRDIVAPGDRFQIKGSRFRIWADDFIDLEVNQPAPFVNCMPLIPGNCDGTTRAANVAKADLWGNEIEASYEDARIRLALGYATVNGKSQATGLRLGVLTPDQITLNSAVKLPELQSVVGMNAIFADRFDKVNSPADERPGYSVFDFFYSWQPSGGALNGLRLDLGVDNAFDKSYSRVFTGAAEQGRNYKVTAAYTLNW